MLPNQPLPDAVKLIRVKEANYLKQKVAFNLIKRLTFRNKLSDTPIISYEDYF